MTKIVKFKAQLLIILLILLQAGLLVYFFSKNDGIRADGPNENINNDYSLSETQKRDLPVHYSYFSNQDFFDEAYEQATAFEITDKKTIFGGILPHHLVVKDKIAAFFLGLEQHEYDTVILIGPNHFERGDADIITSNAVWKTPYGDIGPALQLVSKLDIRVEEEPFIEEHSIPGLVSFIRKSLPSAKILPIILKNGTKQTELENLIKKISENTKPEKTLVLASVDFSHYLPIAVADFHDVASRAAIENFDFDKIAGLEIDSPASIYAVLKYLEVINAKDAQFLASTNSGDLSGDSDGPTTSHNFYYFGQGPGEKKKNISMMFFGDLMIDRHVGEKIDKNGMDYLFLKIKGEENRFFSGVDVISANLEGAVTDEGVHYAPQNAYDFAFAPARIETLKDYGFNFFTLANNHFSDQGERGIMETRKNLDELEISYVGCKDREVADCSTKSLEVNGMKIGMAGFSQVYGLINIDEVSERVANLKLISDFVIVNIHWGTEYEHSFGKIQQEVAHRLIDNGADLIIGHHPHVVQGMEVYKGKAIFYSLGNFIFDQYFSEDTQAGLAIGVLIEADSVAINLFPLKSKASQVFLGSGQNKIKALSDIVAWSNLDEKYKMQIKTGSLILEK